MHTTKPPKLFALATSLSRSLGSVPSLLYAGTYLLLIPGWALLYSNLPPRSFIHANLKYDPTFLATKADTFASLKPYLEETIALRFKQRGQDVIAEVNDLEPTEAGSIEMSLYVFYGIERPKYLMFVPGKSGFVGHAVAVTNKGRYLGYNLWGTVTADVTRSKDSTVFEFRKPHFFPIDAGCSGDDGDSPASSKKKTPKSQKLSDCNTGIGLNVKVEEPLAFSLNRVLEEYRGFNYGSDARVYSRMLYFSAVTITTIGYGDIVPVTGRARASAMTEAVLGVVLMGLFLNALSFQRSSRE